MLKSVPVHNGAHQHRTQDAELLKESGAHKLVIADRDGNCLAFVLAWDSFDYDAESDTYVCVADSDGRELMTMYTTGEIRVSTWRKHVCLDRTGRVQWPPGVVGPF